MEQDAAAGIAGIAGVVEKAVVPAQTDSDIFKPVCNFYMKTGTCKYDASCKWTHPADRSAVDMVRVRLSTEAVAEQRSKMTTTSFPHRVNVLPCTHFMRNRECKFGAACKFDHPYGVTLPQRVATAPNCSYYMKST